MVIIHHAIMDCLPLRNAPDPRSADVNLIPTHIFILVDFTDSYSILLDRAEEHASQPDLTYPLQTQFP